MNIATLITTTAEMFAAMEKASESMDSRCRQCGGQTKPYDVRCPGCGERIPEEGE